LTCSRKSQRCSQRRIRSDALDELVWEEVSTRRQDPELVLEAYREGRTHRVDRDESGSNEQAQKLATQIKLANTEMTRLLDAYQVGAIQLSDLQKRRRLVESKLDTLNREKELLEKIAAEQRHEGDARGELQEFAALVADNSTSTAASEPPFSPSGSAPALKSRYWNCPEPDGWQATVARRSVSA